MTLGLARSGSWRNIPIALVDAIFSEQKAQTCENMVVTVMGVSSDLWFAAL